MRTRMVRALVIACGIGLAVLSATGCRGLVSLFDDDGVFPGDVQLPAGDQAAVDAAVSPWLDDYRYLNVALVAGGEIASVTSYGRNRTNAREIYASVSKPVTATIVLRLLEDGTIASLDDPISACTDRYDDALPEEFADSEVTLRHLLVHQSGLPGQAPLVRSMPWPLLFAPGTDTSYSTWGYGVIGAVLEDITGRKYGALVKEYIGEPVGGESFRADDLFFDTPGGRVWSTVDDMARFAIGICNGTYITEDTLHSQVLQVYGSDVSGDIGLGWYVVNTATGDPGMYHAGSNGAPRAFIAVRPFSGAAVCIAARARSEDVAGDLGQLALELMEIVTGP